MGTQVFWVGPFECITECTVSGLFPRKNRCATTWIRNDFLNFGGDSSVDLQDFLRVWIYSLSCECYPVSPALARLPSRWVLPRFSGSEAARIVDREGVHW